VDDAETDVVLQASSDRQVLAYRDPKRFEFPSRPDTGEQ
jgi:hypothetical protein